METSFFSRQELSTIGFKSFGENVLISRFSRIYGPEKIAIGHDVRIDDFCILSGGSGIQLGNYIHIAAYSALYGGGGVVMEDFSGLSSRVTLYSESDDYSGKSMTNPMVPKACRPTIQISPIHIGRHCLIGTGSTVLPGIIIGEGAAIGAHSLIMKNCEPWKIYFGAPAKAIRNRRKDLLVLEEKVRGITDFLVKTKE